MGELDGFMRRVKKVDEFVELFFSMESYHKDVIYVTPPYERFKRRLGQYFLFKITHGTVGVGRCHFCAHCCAVQFLPTAPLATFAIPSYVLKLKHPKLHFLPTKNNSL